MPEAIWFESRGHRPLFAHGIVLLLGFGGWDVADRFEQPPMVEPVALRLPSNDAAHRRNLIGRLRPFEGRIFDSLEAAPRATPMDGLGLVKAIDRLGQGVVVAVADAADRRFDARFSEAFGVFDRDVLGGLNPSLQPGVCRSLPSIGQAPQRVSSSAFNWAAT